MYVCLGTFLGGNQIKKDCNHVLPFVYLNKMTYDPQKP